MSDNHPSPNTPNIEVSLVDFDSHGDVLYSIRHKVFVEEQHVPVEEELDDRDNQCRHVLVLVDDVPMATGRIDLEKHGKIGRVAVHAHGRKLGLGRQVMAALEQIAREAGLPKVQLSAQNSAIGFYQKLGYEVCGEEFMDAGIPHHDMEKSLA